jgi:hypothetical protein
MAVFEKMLEVFGRIVFIMMIGYLTVVLAFPYLYDRIKFDECIRFGGEKARESCQVDSLQRTGELEKSLERALKKVFELDNLLRKEKQ